MNYQQGQQQPPPYGMAPPPQTVVYTAQPTNIIVPMAFGPESSRVTCPLCHATIQTRVDKESTIKTHLFALLLCLIFCPCVIVPYCMDSCKTTNHYCPSCNTYLGKYDE